MGMLAPANQNLHRDVMLENYRNPDFLEPKAGQDGGLAGSGFSHSSVTPKKTAFLWGGATV